MLRAKKRPSEELHVDDRAQSQISRLNSEANAILSSPGGNGSVANSGMIVNPPPCSTIPNTAVSLSTDIVSSGFHF